jgi:hypothetical protein
MQFSKSVTLAGTSKDLNGRGLQFSQTQYVVVAQVSALWGESNRRSIRRNELDMYHTSLTASTFFAGAVSP